jgi:transcription elongation factor GreA
MADEAPQYHITREGLEKLREELQHKINVERPALASRLQAAIQQGDLTENADYTMAKEEQSFLEGRIKELRELIQGAVIIDERKTGATVRLGSRVTVIEDGQDSPETFLLVGPVEADPRAGRISDESPLGQALIGRKVGDVVEIEAPAGNLTFTITEIA